MFTLKISSNFSAEIVMYPQQGENMHLAAALVKAFIPAGPLCSKIWAYLPYLLLNPILPQFHVSDACFVVLAADKILFLYLI